MNEEWKTDYPTKPGWYWAIWKPEALLGIFEPRIDMVYIDGWAYAIWTTGNSGPVYKERFIYWLGPIPAPQLPEELQTP